MINETLNKEYPKLLKTVHGSKSEAEKKKAVYEFIELLDVLVKDLYSGKTK